MHGSFPPLVCFFFVPAVLLACTRTAHAGWLVARIAGSFEPLTFPAPPPVQLPLEPRLFRVFRVFLRVSDPWSQVVIFSPTSPSWYEVTLESPCDGPHHCRLDFPKSRCHHHPYPCSQAQRLPFAASAAAYCSPSLSLPPPTRRGVTIIVTHAQSRNSDVTLVPSERPSVRVEAP